VRGTLKSRKQFNEVYEKGRKVVGRHLVAFALPRPLPDSVGDARGVAVGVVASRKVGGAVHRARAKRLLRAAFAPLRARVPAQRWIVLVARAAIVDPGVTSNQVREEMERLLLDLELLDGSGGIPHDSGGSWPC